MNSVCTPERFRIIMVKPVALLGPDTADTEGVRADDDGTAAGAGSLAAEDHVGVPR